MAIDLEEDGASSGLRVSDTGPGPPADLAGSLFEPFVSGKAEGVGLGLALARKVAEMHHGTLSWTRDGAWTRFRLCLPVKVADEGVKTTT